jgi:xanthine dehydrogenase YagS FAD-binding subunit
VAHKPWRAVEAEGVLRGADATEGSFRRAADEELRDARGYAHNAFKIELAKRTIVGVLNDLTDRERGR